MADRRVLEGVLTRATAWVRQEFAYVDEVAAGLGCERRVEIGPGVAYRLGGRLVARNHPKLRHVALGFDKRIHADVEALTAALRAQKGMAWFNYGPGIADRDTVELLFGRSADATGPRLRHRVSAARSDRQGPVDDDADLRLVLSVLRAFVEHERETGKASPVKPLREVLFFGWEGPRLPAGGKYSPSIPHSPAAIEHRRRSGRPVGLVYEHVTPVSDVIRRLRDDVPPNEGELRRVLEAAADRVIVTKVEDGTLTAAGNRDSSPEEGDPWSRYRVLGLKQSDFSPFIDSAG